MFLIPTKHCLKQTFVRICFILPDFWSIHFGYTFEIRKKNSLLDDTEYEES